MKKLFVLILVVTVIFVSSCSESKSANAVDTSSQETTIATEETTETAVETIAESHLNHYKMDSVSETTVTKTKETTTSLDTTETAVVDKRQTTGDGGSLSFQTGDTVMGAAIEINGHTFTNSIIKNAPMGGIVISGVIWPWESEMSGLTIISNDEILAPISDPTTSIPTETTTVETTVPTETTAIAVEKVRTQPVPDKA